MKNIIPFLSFLLLIPLSVFSNEYHDKAEKLMDAGLYSKAIIEYTNAANSGFMASQAALGDIYLSGIGVDVDKQLALKWLEMAGAQGDAISQNNVGDIYIMGSSTVNKDPVKAGIWFKKAADQGLGIAQANLGSLYVMGLGVSKDIEKGKSLLLKAASQNVEVAFTILASLEGKVVSPEDAFKMFYDLALEGTAYAQYEIGKRFFTGNGVTKNADLSAKWIESAANLGQPEAQHIMGLSYYYGRNKPKNVATAVTWFKEASDQNYAESQYHLGMIYLVEEGVNSDLALGMKYLRMAAEQGHEKSLNLIAQITQ